MSNTTVEKKLSNEEIARVFCLYGIDSEVMTMDGKASIMTLYPGAVEVVVNVIGHGQIMKGRKGGAEMHYKYFYKPEEIKLLLTSLSNIKDKDAVDIGRILGWPDPDAEDWKSHILKNYELGICPSQVHQYLISKYYAVPLFFGTDHPCNGLTA